MLDGSGGEPAWGDFPTGDWDDELKVTSLARLPGLGAESGKEDASFFTFSPPRNLLPHAFSSYQVRLLFFHVCAHVCLSVHTYEHVRVKVASWLASRSKEPVLKLQLQDLSSIYQMSHPAPPTPPSWMLIQSWPSYPRDNSYY